MEMVMINLTDAIKSGKVISTGGELKTGPNFMLSISSKVTNNYIQTITPTILVQDFGHDREKRLSFEMEHFAGHVLASCAVNFSEIFDRAQTRTKSKELVASIANGLIWNICKKIRFNITQNIVSCFMRISDDLTLRSVNALEWKHDEHLGDFFEVRKRSSISS